MKVAIVWGSTTGQTEDAAHALRDSLDGIVEAVLNVERTSAREMHAYDALIIGVSTWDIGELQYDWAGPAEELAELDWTGKYIAFFGCGDALGYPDTFVDAFGILWEQLEPRGGILLGQWPTAGYAFRNSRSLSGDRTKFLGLPLDQDNEPELTDERIRLWAAQLREELQSVAVMEA